LQAPSAIATDTSPLLEKLPSLVGALLVRHVYAVQEL
jgi:hypothetical protein